jgi:superfamily I DNA and/or RNA helicase
MESIQELGKLAEVLLLERAEEERRLAAVLRERSVKERRAEGLCWHPVKVTSTKFGFGGQPVMHLERSAGTHPAHQFQRGTPVFIYDADDEEKRYKATVSALRNDEMEVTLFQDDFPEGYREKTWGIEVRFDDRTFFEMERALNVAINLEAGAQRLLRDKILGYEELTSSTEELSADVNDRLNPSQQSAVKAILASEDVVAVHGPPGTGKTTTLTEAIRLLASRGEQLLVCAPSNTAVDHLTLKLAAAGVKVTRIGRLGRMDEDVFPNALETQLDEAAEMRTVNDLRQRAFEAEKAADRYIRNFGAKEREERRAQRQEAKALRKEALELERYAEQRILNEAQAITSTLVGASDVRIRDRRFATVVIDEAAQALEPACWIPVLKGDKLVLAGDPLQLPPTVKSQKAAKGGLETSLLEKFIDRHQTSHLLEEQYRMNKLIMGFSNEWFYEGRLKAHASVASGALRRKETTEPVLEFIDTAGCGFEEEREAEGLSLTNSGEANILSRHLGQLFDHYAADIDSVGVISPYRAQVEALKKQLPEDNRIAIQTVDGFQGQERDVIYISLVRSNLDGQLGFLTDYRRMNVAMTRAKRKLVVIGDSATLGSDAFYAAFLEYCEKHEAYRSAWEWMEY